MRLRALLLLVLLLPGVALGPGWSLRFCAVELLGARGCCSAAAKASCCPSDERTPLEPQSDIASTCSHCCIDIATLGAQPVPTPEPLAQALERTQAAALAIVLPSTDVPPVHLAARLAHEGSARTADPVPPAPPGRCTPLPLRI